MAKFSFDRDEEEEESPSTSSTISKRQRRAVEETNGSEEHPCHDAHDPAVESKKEESGMSVTLMDPEVLDCSICMEPLSPPVFQCENGHIACSPCCTKLRNKCPSCSWPIGYNRCLAIEKVIESIKLSCTYKPYGCIEKITYMKKQTHEETCLYAPCSCPISDCDFHGSSKQLSLHFDTKHWSSARRFQYNCPFSVSFDKLESYVVFQGEEDGRLFVLSNQIEVIGSAITVVCLGPSCSSGGWSYDVVARNGGGSLKLQSHTKCVNERSKAGVVSIDVLVVPYGYYCESGKLKLEVCIWSAHEVC